MLALTAATCGAQSALSVRAGLIHHVVGEVYLDGRLLDPNSTKLESLKVGERLRTASGRAEIVLTAGRMLRLDRGAEIELVSDELLSPIFLLRTGSIIVEWTTIFGDGEALIQHDDGGVRLRKAGRYRVDAKQGLMAQLRVFDGKAWVEGESRTRSVGKGRLLALAATDQRPSRFDQEALDGFDRWNMRRSRVVARSNRRGRAGNDDGQGPRGRGRGRRGGWGDASERMPRGEGGGGRLRRF